MKTILLVEDDNALVFGLRYALEKEGYEVVHADSVKAAKELFHTGISLVLLDIMLPDGSGYEVCGYIRELSQVPVIFLTACDSEVNTVTGLDMGADDYICKPFRLGELMSRIRAVIRRSESCAEIIPEEGLGLTLAETRLLTLLKANKGQTLTRMQILDKLWDNKGEFVDDNTLSVHISRLREKIGSGHIVTVRGVGYRWEN